MTFKNLANASTARAILAKFSKFSNILVLLNYFKDCIRYPMISFTYFIVTGYMIANLAIADLMVALFCLPVTLIYMELKTWPFGYAMCKILPFVQAISVMGSVGTLTVISIGK